LSLQSSNAKDEEYFVENKYQVMEVVNNEFSRTIKKFIEKGEGMATQKIKMEKFCGNLYKVEHISAQIWRNNQRRYRHSSKRRGR
jgi:hypothetical protein